MIAFPNMLLAPAKRAGMSVPDNADDFDIDQYPHFNIYCLVQLGASLPYASAHWDNAHVVAIIPMDKIKTVTMNDLIAASLAIGNSSIYN